MIAWSYGGGVQTAAIAVLVRDGILPKPDITVIADTGRERRTTWDYLRDVIQPYLDPVGVKVKVASHSLAGTDLYPRGGGATVMPAWTQEGRLPTYCSGEWKRDVVERWLRQQGVREAVLWIGFSLDEQHRCGKPHRPWLIPTYPLVERRVTRRACYALIEKAGLPVPSKSRCWMCPHQNAEEWREVRADPEEWDKAVALDAAIREADERGGLFLHSQRVPLEMADLGRPGDDMPLFRACQDAGCYT